MMRTPTYSDRPGQGKASAFIETDDSKAWRPCQCDDLAMTMNDSTARVRKTIIRLTIGSFSIAALLGILALLKGGEFSDTQGNVLLTTLLVGVVSIAVLCYLGTASKRYQWVGILG